jgi:hypothetical protein
MTLPRLAAFSPLSLVACLGACAGPLNNEHGIGNAGRTFGNSVYTPSTVAEGIHAAPPEGLEATIDQKSAPVYHASGPVPAAGAEPSLTTLDRDNWGATRVDVPTDFPAHQPRFARNYIITATNPRAQGKFPDERTALGTATTRHNNEQFIEALVAPAVAGANVVMMVPRMIMESRSQEPTRTGGEGYERSPRSVTITNPTAETIPGLVQGDVSAAPIPAGQTPTSSPTTTPVKKKPPATGSPRIIRPVVPGQQSPTAEPAAEDLRPGGGMPASDIPPSAKP